MKGQSGQKKRKRLKNAIGEWQIEKEKEKSEKSKRGREEERGKLLVWFEVRKFESLKVGRWSSKRRSDHFNRRLQPRNMFTFAFRLSVTKETLVSVDVVGADSLRMNRWRPLSNNNSDRVLYSTILAHKSIGKILIRRFLITFLKQQQQQLFYSILSKRY